MKPTVIVSSAMALLLVLVSLLTSVPAAYAQLDVPRFEPAPCPVEVPDEPEIECGVLLAPEDPANPGGRTVRLPVLIVRSPAPDPAPDPLLVTLGGPGLTSVGEVWGYARSGFVQERDVVILEQRGNLYAQPSLDCDLSTWVDAQEGYTPCLDSLRARGIEPRYYTASTIAADIGALFEVMDYEEWNLFGTSFSTRLMLLAMRDHPERIRSVILQSVNSGTDTRYAHDPEHSVRALQVLFADCARDPACAAAYPDLEARFYSLYSRLNADPESFEIPDIATGEPVLRSVDGYTLLEWMVGDAFYGPARPPHKTAYLPLLITKVEDGNTDLLYPWAKEHWGRLNSLQYAFGLYLSVNCQDDYRPGTREAMNAQTEAYPRLDGYLRFGREVEICDAWGLEPAAPLFDAPLESEIPTLVLAGAYDPVTPPNWSRETAQALGNAFYVEFPGAGHDVNMGSPCTEQIMVDFLRDPAQRPDASCAAAAPQVVMPDEVLLVPNFYEYYYGDIGRNRAEHSLYLVTENGFLVVLLLVLVAVPLWLVRWRSRGARFDAVVCGGLVSAGLVSLIFFLFSQQMRAVSRNMATGEGALIRFGVPAGTAVWFGLALAGAVLTAGIVALTGYAWLRQRGPRLGRIALTASLLPAAGFAVLLGVWGWLCVLF